MDVQLFLNNCSNLSDSYIKKIYDFTKQLFHQAYKNGLTTMDISEDLIRPSGKVSDSGRSLTDRATTSFFSQFYLAIGYFLKSVMIQILLTHHCII